MQISLVTLNAKLQDRVNRVLFVVSMNRQREHVQEGIFMLGMVLIGSPSRLNDQHPTITTPSLCTLTEE